MLRNHDQILLENLYTKNVLKEDVNESYSLYWKDSEHEETRKWYTASTPEELLKQINHDNLTGDFEYGMVDEDHEFKSFEELLDFVQHSDFIITKGNKIIAGYPVKVGDWEKDSHLDLSEASETNPQVPYKVGDYVILNHPNYPAMQGKKFNVQQVRGDMVDLIGIDANGYAEPRNGVFWVETKYISPTSK